MGVPKAAAAINLGVRDDVGIVVIGNAEIICLGSRLEVIIRRLPENMNCNNIVASLYE